MLCNQLPPHERWEDASESQLREYRAHLRSCLACRRRIFSEAPDELLFELSDDSLPDDFWIGFWPSLQPRLSRKPQRVSAIRVIRWAAVFVLALILAVYSGRHSTVPQPAKPLPAVTHEYPLIEDVQNPDATYYIFQSDGGQKIVLFFDPKAEL